MRMMRRKENHVLENHAVVIIIIIIIIDTVVAFAATVVNASRFCSATAAPTIPFAVQKVMWKFVCTTKRSREIGTMQNQPHPSIRPVKMKAHTAANTAIEAIVANEIAIDQRIEQKPFRAKNQRRKKRTNPLYLGK